MDGYKYGFPVGGEHVCKRCGVPVRDTETHDTWHESLHSAIWNASTGVWVFGQGEL